MMAVRRMAAYPIADPRYYQAYPGYYPGYPGYPNYPGLPPYNPDRGWLEGTNIIIVGMTILVVGIGAYSAYINRQNCKLNQKRYEEEHKL